jgi:hypothetical protein
MRDLATSAVTQLTTLANGARGAAWARNGSLVAFVATPIGSGADAGSSYPAAGTADVYVIAPDGTGQRDVVGVWDAGSVSGGGGYPWYYPSKVTFGPDSTTVVFERAESINAIGIDGTGLRQIAGTPTEGTETPSVSPNGTRVAFASWNGAGENVLTTSYAGDSADPAHDGLATIIAAGTSVSRNRNPAWGSTGFVAYEAVNIQRGTASISTVPAEGGTPSAVTPPGSFDDRNPAWAPPGFVPPS